MFKGLKGKISKGRSKDLNTSSPEQEPSRVGQDLYLCAAERCKHQAGKKKNSMGELLGGETG